MAMKIAICDDMASVCFELEKMLIVYSNSKNELFDIQLYYTGEALYNDLSRGACFDMIFLDIELPGVGGVTIGRYIREEMENYEMVIVYISSYEKYAMELFQVKTFDFLVKPLRQESINKVMEEYRRFCCKGFSLFQHGKGRSEVVSYVKDILYFTINDRLIEMCTVSNRELFYGRLKDVAARLDGHQFFYANKSQLVNSRKIKDWGYNLLVMENGEKIPISQGRRKGVAQIHKEYMKRKYRWGNMDGDK